MKTPAITSRTLAASVLAGVLVFAMHAAFAQNSPPPSTATRPAKEPPGQTSLPNNSPPATTTQTTGETRQDPTIKQMNKEEQQKVNTEGK